MQASSHAIAEICPRGLVVAVEDGAPCDGGERCVLTQAMMTETACLSLGVWAALGKISRTKSGPKQKSSSPKRSESSPIKSVNESRSTW